jgi:hypothetical protein
MKRTLLSIFLFAMLPVVPIVADMATNYFAVSNLNSTAGSVLVGTAYTLYGNQNFYLLSSTTNFGPLTNGQSAQVGVVFAPTNTGDFTDYVIFVSNGGNLTNLVTGTGIGGINSIVTIKTLGGGLFGRGGW